MTNGIASSPIASPSTDILTTIIPSKEDNNEIMYLAEQPWDEYQWHDLVSSSSALNMNPLKSLSLHQYDIVPPSLTLVQELYSEGNLGNLVGERTFLPI